MKSRLCILLAFLLTLQFSGCAVVTALKQPDKKNLSVLSQGMSRDNVITVLGAPISTETSGEDRIEIYQFTQGYSGGAKTSRALMHGVLDVATLFIWELIGWPMEAIVDGNRMTVKVIYDKDSKIKDVIYLEKK